MKHLLSVVACVWLGLTVQAQIIIRNVTENSIEKLQYPNSLMNAHSSMPVMGVVNLKDGTVLKGKMVCYEKDGKFSKVKMTLVDGKREVEAASIRSIKLDPIITEQKFSNDYKNPEKNFQPGYMLLIDGVRVKGKVALNRNLGDYNFFVYSIFFLPEGSSVASTVKGGALREFGQEVDGQLNIWDGYADGFVKRLVDGRYRLSRNPYSTTKNEFFTSVKNQALDTLAKEAAQEAFDRTIENGKDLNESIESAVNAAEVMQAIGTIQINRKEYLVLDTRTKAVRVIQKEGFKEYANSLLLTCKNQLPVDAKAQKEFLDWANIETFMKFVNEKCVN